MVFMYFSPAIHVGFDGYPGSVLISKAVCSLEAQFPTSVYPHPNAFPESPVNLAFSDSQFWGWDRSVQLWQMWSHLNPSLQLLCLSPHEQWQIKELGLCSLLWKFRHCGANSQKHFSVCSHCTSSVSGNLLEYYLNNNHKSFQSASPGLQTAEWLLTSCHVTACLCCSGTFALSSTTCSRLVGKAKLKGQWQKGHRPSQDAVEAEEKFQSWRILWSVWNLLETLLNM